jgi:SAM-dependent methyltransferase
MDEAQYRLMDAEQAWHWWYVGRRAMIEAVLEACLQGKEASICEVGCGTGGNLALLARHGRLFAIETDPFARELSRGKGVCEVLPGSLPDDVRWQGFRDGPREGFDLICAFDVLEHIADDHAALGRIYEGLKPGGLLLLTVPAHPWMWSTHDLALHHCRRYRKRDLEMTVERAGFEKLRLGYFNSLLFPPIAAYRFCFQSIGRGKAARHGVSDSKEVVTGRQTFVNDLLTRIFGFESVLVRRLALGNLLPFGVSLVGLWKRPD